MTCLQLNFLYVTDLTQHKSLSQVSVDFKDSIINSNVIEYENVLPIDDEADVEPQENHISKLHTCLNYA